MVISYIATFFILLPFFVPCMHAGQPMIDPVLVIGRLGEMVTITCIVGPIEPSSTHLITNGSRQLTASSQTIHRDRVVFTYGPLVMSDARRRLVCRYGNVDAVGSIRVLCKSVLFACINYSYISYMLNYYKVKLI